MKYLYSYTLTGWYMKEDGDYDFGVTLEPIYGDDVDTLREQFDRPDNFKIHMEDIHKYMEVPL